MLVNASETYEVSDNINISAHCETEKVCIYIADRDKYIGIPIEELTKLIKCLTNINDNFYKKPLVEE